MKRKPNTNPIYCAENLVTTLQVVWDAYNNMSHRTKRDAEMAERVRSALSDASDLLGSLLKAKYGNAD